MSGGTEKSTIESSLVNVEEMIATQERILKMIKETTECAARNEKVFEEAREKADEYTGLLHEISRDMVDVCERIEALKRRMTDLERK